MVLFLFMPVKHIILYCFDVAAPKFFKDSHTASSS